MGLTIGVYNRKGGVGKTTSVINIGASLAVRGKKILLVDGDSQINLSRFFLRDNENYYAADGTPAQDTPTLYECLEEGAPITDAMTQLEFEFEKVKYAGKEEAKRIAAELEYVGAQVEVSDSTGAGKGKFKRSKISIKTGCSLDLIIGSKDMVYYSVDDQDSLKNALKPVKNEYDYILVEYPPSFNLATMAYLNACDYVVVPLRVGEDESVDGYLDLVDRIKEAREYGSTVKILGLFYTFVHENWKSHSELMEMSTEQQVFFKSRIRELGTPIREAKAARGPLCIYCPDSSVAKDYMSLADEIEGRVGEES